MYSFITILVCGITFLIVGRYMKRNPPAKINPYKGYRTKRSKASQEAWDHAQLYSADVMQQTGKYLSIAAVPFLLLQNNLFTIILGSIVILFFCMVPIFSTEKELKEKFGDK
jgi:uncharacterized membrane protein